MSVDCFCDYDPPSVYRAKLARARKTHRCDECGGAIAPGELYENVFGVWAGDASTVRTCERCYDLRVWTKNNVPCLCIMHGDMDEMIRGAVEDACLRAHEETAGLRFGLARRLHARDLHNGRARRKPRTPSQGEGQAFVRPLAGEGAAHSATQTKAPHSP